MTLKDAIIPDMERDGARAVVLRSKLRHFYPGTDLSLFNRSIRWGERPD